MARALALGWGEPVLCTDSGSGRAKELAALVGGQAVGSNRELAERADVVVLAHKPAQLDAVAREIAGSAKLVVSILARTTQAEVRAAYPETPVFRIEPNTPVEVKRGVLAFAIPVIINLQGSETDLSKRLIDFASGLTYALDGGMQRIADKVFLLTPRNVELSSEERARLIEKGFFNQS